jgi:hypothetical protein
MTSSTFFFKKAKTPRSPLWMSLHSRITDIEEQFVPAPVHTFNQHVSYLAYLLRE